MRLTQLLSDKDPQEVIPITFDLKKLMHSIDSATVSVSVKSGIDNNPADLLYSSVKISDAKVSQLIKGGIDGVVYLIRINANKGSEKYSHAVYLKVKAIL